MQNSKCNRRCGARAEAKSYLDYAEPREGKACEAGLKFKMQNYHLIIYRLAVNICYIILIVGSPLVALKCIHHLEPVMVVIAMIAR